MGKEQRLREPLPGAGEARSVSKRTIPMMSRNNQDRHLPFKPIVCAAALFALCGRATAGEPSFIDALDNAFVKVCADVSPAVVRVTAAVKKLHRDEGLLFERPDPFEDFNRKFFGEKNNKSPYPLGIGSGLIFDPSGLILTNEHVVSGQTEATVRLESGEVFKAKVLGSDSRVDLAVLKIDAGRELKAAKFGEAEKVRVGQFVIAFGHPFGVGQDPQPSRTMGHVSALDRMLTPRGDHRALTGLIQTDAAVNPGNSGGPLVNLRSEVIGINVAIFTMSKGSQGIAFAIPMSEGIKDIIDKLSRGLQIARGYVGLRTKELTPDLAKTLGVKAQSGVLVDLVAKGSPAEKAGLKRGDVLLSINKKKFRSGYEFRVLAESLHPGDKVPVEVLRDGKTVPLTLTVGRKDVKRLMISRFGPKAWRGLEVEQINDGHVRKFGLKVQRGVVVTKVHVGSPAHAAGFREGMVVQEFNKRPVETVEQFKDFARGAGSDDALIVTNDGYMVLKAK